MTLSISSTDGKSEVRFVVINEDMIEITTSEVGELPDTSVLVSMSDWEELTAAIRSIFKMSTETTNS